MVVLIVVPKLLLHAFCLPLFLYVGNECCMKSLRPAFCWKWTYRSVLRATTTTTPTTTTTTSTTTRCRVTLNVSQTLHASWPGGRFSKHAKVTLTNSCYLNLGYGQILPSRAIFKTFQQSTVVAFDRIIDHKLRQPLIKCYGESAGC